MTKIGNKILPALWLDDYFGPHQYGVWAHGKKVHKAEDCEQLEDVPNEILDELCYQYKNR